MAILKAPPYNMKFQYKDVQRPGTPLIANLKIDDWLGRTVNEVQPFIDEFCEVMTKNGFNGWRNPSGNTDNTRERKRTKSEVANRTAHYHEWPFVNGL